MNEKLKTKFKLSYSVKNMRNQAEKIAKEQGLKNPDEIDAFRHAYVSAKVSEVTNGVIAKEAGRIVEWGREGKERTNSLDALFDQNPKTKWKGNPKDEWQQDMANNQHGIDKEQKLDKLNLSAEEKESRLRRELADDVKKGKLQTKPESDKRQYYDSEQSDKNETFSVTTKLEFPNDKVAKEQQDMAIRGVTEKFGDGVGNKQKPVSIADYYDKGNKNSGGSVKVDGYTRSDGTRVGTYTRSNPR